MSAPALPSSTPPHIARVREEYTDLDDRLGRLVAFIVSNDVYPTLNPYDRNLLCIQMQTMQAYRAVLYARIERHDAAFAEFAKDP